MNQVVISVYDNWFCQWHCHNGIIVVMNSQNSRWAETWSCQLGVCARYKITVWNIWRERLQFHSGKLTTRALVHTIYDKTLRTGSTWTTTNVPRLVDSPLKVYPCITLTLNVVQCELVMSRWLNHSWMIHGTTLVTYCCTWQSWICWPILVELGRCEYGSIPCKCSRCTATTWCGWCTRTTLHHIL